MLDTGNVQACLTGVRIGEKIRYGRIERGGMPRKLSKSKYVTGLICPKILWLQAHFK